MPKADLVLFNGRVRTLDPNLPFASAVAVHAGRILAVGSDEQVLSVGGEETARLDLRGRALLPAFTDAHIHLCAYGLNLTRVQLDDVPSLLEAVERVGERARSMGPGHWIHGWGWNRNLWPGAPFPTKEDLDPVTPDNPVYLLSKDGHAAWLNSLALCLAGISADTVDPPGGCIERQKGSGEPSGVIKEGPAMELVDRVVGSPSEEELASAIEAATKHLHRFGVVAVQAPEEPYGLSALQVACHRGDLQLRVNVWVADKHMESALAMGLRGGLGDEFLRLGAIKAFADGSLGSRTAEMFEPYSDEPGNRGVAVSSSERLSQLVARATQGGWNVAIHAIGDQANSRVLDALEEHWAEWSARRMRPRIEHAQLLAPQDLPRLGTMGVVASMQPVHCTSDMAMAEEHWGPRCSHAYAWRSLLESGATLAFGSDAPVEEPDVLRGLYAATTRQREDGTPGGGWHPEQCLTIEQAVYGYTQGAAFACGEERQRGSLTVGKAADLVVLSKDILAVQPTELLHTRVDATLLAGRAVYDAVGDVQGLPYDKGEPE